MKIGVACGLLTAATLSFGPGTLAYAADHIKARETPISLVGCVQRETDYRRQNNAGKGGFLGFGGGLGDEYVLVNASRGAEGAFGDCTAATGGEAYELTGSGEGDLERFVGERVALAGTRKEAEIDAVTGRPTGGRQVGSDLRLFEVDVESFRALGAPVQTGTVARVDQDPLPLEQDQQVTDTRRVGTSTAQRRERIDTDAERLPRTASPLALTGLIGFLSLVGAGMLRMQGRARF